MTKTFRISAGVIAAAALAALAACSQEAPAPTASAPAASEPAASEPAAPPAAAEAPAVELVALEITDATGAQLSGDPARGQRIFAQCMACHSLNAGENRVGPSLHGIVGRAAGTVEGFRYSDANKNSGITWTEQKMWEYLQNPQATIPGTIMAFAGVRDPQQRADLIAYIRGAD